MGSRCERKRGGAPPGVPVCRRGVLRHRVQHGVAVAVSLSAAPKALPPTRSDPRSNFGAQMAVHGRVAHDFCEVCDRLERIQGETESFLRAFGMSSEDMIDGV